MDFTFIGSMVRDLEKKVIKQVFTDYLKREPLPEDYRRFTVIEHASYEEGVFIKIDDFLMGFTRRILELEKMEVKFVPFSLPVIMEDNKWPFELGIASAEGRKLFDWPLKGH